jgi:UDP-N-acetylmuramoyl-tripeptide--D-alanyl-D-alanine ligase
VQLEPPAVPRPEEAPPPSRTWLRLHPLDTRVPGLAKVPRPARRALWRLVLTRRVRRHTAALDGVRFVAVTGSMGKTTTKDLVAEMLALAGPTLKTRGTANGIDAVPPTLLAVRPDHRFAAIELGIFDDPGEMAWMASLFEPHVAVLTGIGEDHVAEYGSKAAVAREKRRLLERLGSEGTAVVNADDDLARASAEDLSCRVVLAGRAADADVRVLGERLAWPDGIDVDLDANGARLHARLRIPGRHYATVVALAVAAARACGVAPEHAVAAVERVEPAPGRLSVEPGPNGSTLLMDDYKSRLPTARAALAVLAEAPAERRLAVVGEMQERELTPAAYRELADILAATTDLTIAVGRAAPLLRGSFPDATRFVAVPRVEDAAARLADVAAAGDVILVHGATRQHLRRVALLLRRAPVGCTVRRCVFHWFCHECIYLRTRPPASCVEIG